MNKSKSRRETGNKKSIIIGIAMHKNYRIPSSPCYMPLFVGKALKPDLKVECTCDNTGDNISAKNPYYCELTGLYWMWKNTDSDYLGLVHYRRHFRTEKFSLKKDPFEKVLTEREAYQLLKKNDIILPRKRYYLIETLASHYAHTHYAHHLDLIREILVKNQPGYVETFDKVMNYRSAHMYNMFIMKREKLNAYCEWLFPLLFELEDSVCFEEYDPYQARLVGRIAELLLDVWIEKNQYRYHEVPVINMEKINWWKKGTSFLKAKYLKKRYNASF